MTTHIDHGHDSILHNSHEVALTVSAYQDSHDSTLRMIESGTTSLTLRTRVTRYSPHPSTPECVILVLLTPTPDACRALTQESQAGAILHGQTKSRGL